MISDALAGRNAGCRGSILVRTGNEPPIGEDHEFPVCADLPEALSSILKADPPQHAKQ